MSKATKTLEIKLLDRELSVACPEEERGELLDAVAFLDKRMREIRDAGKISSIEREEALTSQTLSVEWIPCRQRLMRL
jgi:cell division protein ZapA